MYDFDWSSIPPSLPYLLNGMIITLKITAVAVVFGIIWGTILAVMRLSAFAPIRWFAKLYVNLFRSVPLVMVLLWFYLVVPSFLQQVRAVAKTDIRLISAMVAFALFEAAYYSEIIRAGIQSISRGQSNGAGAGYDAVAVDEADHPAAGVPRHGAAAADAGHRAVPDTSLVYVLSLADFFRTASTIGERDGTSRNGSVCRSGLLRDQPERFAVGKLSEKKKDGLND